jgi:phosphosulfolactate phosphohydrolase-like enzyme
MGFRLARGARNVIAAGLAEDVVYAARPDVLEVVGEVHWDGKVGRLRARGGVGVGK